LRERTWATTLVPPLPPLAAAAVAVVGLTPPPAAAAPGNTDDGAPPHRAPLPDALEALDTPDPSEYPSHDIVLTAGQTRVSLTTGFGQLRRMIQGGR